jgi:hypothetical protein
VRDQLRLDAIATVELRDSHHALNRKPLPRFDWDIRKGTIPAMSSVDGRLGKPMEPSRCTYSVMENVSVGSVAASRCDLAKICENHKSDNRHRTALVFGATAFLKSDSRSIDRSWNCDGYSSIPEHYQCSKTWQTM